MKGNIPYYIRMFQAKANLKFLSESLPKENIVLVLWFQFFQEMKFAVYFHTISLTHETGDW